MSYPTLSFGCICGTKFQNLCIYGTGSLKIGTHLNIHYFQLEVQADFRHLTASFQSFKLKGVCLHIKLNKKVIILH